MRPVGDDPPADGLRRWFPSLADVRIDDAWGGPIDIDDDHRPWFGTLPGGRIHFGLGYSGNGVGPSILGGRILAALATGRASDDEAASLPIVGATPRAFPPEPFRAVGSPDLPRCGRPPRSGRGGGPPAAAYRCRVIPDPALPRISPRPGLMVRG